MQTNEASFKKQYQQYKVAVTIGKLVSEERNQLLLTLNQLFWENAQPPGNAFAGRIMELHNNLVNTPQVARATRETKGLLQSELQNFQNYLLKSMEDAKARLPDIPGVNPAAALLFTQQIDTVKSIRFQDSYMNNYHKMLAQFQASKIVYTETMNQAASMVRADVTGKLVSLLADLNQYLEQRDSIIMTPNRSARIKLASETIRNLETFRSTLTGNNSPQGDPAELYYSLQKSSAGLTAITSRLIDNAKKLGIDTNKETGKGLLYDIVIRVQQSSQAPVSNPHLQRQQASPSTVTEMYKELGVNATDAKMRRLEKVIAEAEKIRQPKHGDKQDIKRPLLAPDSDPQEADKATDTNAAKAKKNRH